jgi:hypothetical protein
VKILFYVISKFAMFWKNTSDLYFTALSYITSKWISVVAEKPQGTLFQIRKDNINPREKPVVGKLGFAQRLCTI